MSPLLCRLAQTFFFQPIFIYKPIFIYYQQRFVLFLISVREIHLFNPWIKTTLKCRRCLVSGLALPGELLAIMGSSGAGKSTLLNTLLFRNSGNIRVRSSYSFLIWVETTLKCRRCIVGRVSPPQHTLLLCHEILFLFIKIMPNRFAFSLYFLISKGIL